MSALRSHAWLGPNVQFSFRSNLYEVSIASKYEDLMAALTLRHSIFYGEWLGTKEPGVDSDEFDGSADHLIIKDLRSGCVIGAYRILCSRFTRKFYSETEFHLPKMFKYTNGTILELGRACVAKEYRNGTVLDLLWKGLGRYASLTNADCFLGCASVLSTSPREVAQLMRGLEEEGHISSDHEVRPLREYQMPGFELFYAFEHSCEKVTQELLPPLVKSYINAGAKILGRPALDRAFQCVDLLTFLPLKEMHRVFKVRYFDNTRKWDKQYSHVLSSTHTHFEGAD